MKIETQITKKDLIHLSCHFFPRSRGTWIYFIMLFLGFFAFISYKDGFTFSQKSMLIGVVASFIGALVSTLIAWLWNLGCILLTSNTKSGVLGKHEYVITDEGLSESTEANESLIKWSGIDDVKINKNYILIRINQYLFHIFPRRSFSSLSKYEEFGNVLSSKANENA
ncbi:YcxB family protein [Microbulbifer thermotolerans]|uniref:YcxB family protein n=1 Tax=Microbulbifer thermotolerans TaxID=252514 RepID=UPI00224B65C8|nr:YcxB family protein [Microbulbifer thermotolerans]MCX2781185.1 YcxB family protein [Microbulbifer thermotolerans]MCX2803455.1 YcxB family protein [Microbulbifer thermotolerans]WKT59963.1 YcxB family protein [Microbulbifer thermotolerans]